MLGRVVSLPKTNTIIVLYLKLTPSSYHQIVTEEGITDLDQYHNCPGTPLIPDFFLGDDYPTPDSYSAADSVCS